MPGLRRPGDGLMVAPCPGCAGAGAIRLPEERRECPYCDGSGVTEESDG